MPHVRVLAPTVAVRVESAVEMYLTNQWWLIVDADERRRSGHRRLLEELGANVIETAIAQDALEMIEACRFQNVLLQTSLGEQSGLLLLREVRRKEQERNRTPQAVILNGEEPYLSVVAPLAGTQLFIEDKVTSGDLVGLTIGFDFFGPGKGNH